MNLFGLSAEQVRDLAVIVAAVVGLATYLLEVRRKKTGDLWATVHTLVPSAHNLVQRIAKVTPTRKDDKFVEILGKLLRAAGFEPPPNSEATFRDLGSAYHQWWKLSRDGEEPLPKELRELSEVLAAEEEKPSEDPS